MEDIRDALAWFGVFEIISLLGTWLYVWVSKSFVATTAWAWFNIGVLSAFSLVALTFAIISAIVGIKKITKKGE